MEQLKNTEYYLLAKGPIRLTNGKYEDQESQRIFTLNDVVTYGDLNRDGVQDAVGAIAISIPNKGDFTYLVALVNRHGNPKNIMAEFLGTGIKIKSLTIKPDSLIEVTMDQYQPGDPDCCPSLGLTRNYKLKAIN
jgi:hypothetical protein